MSVELPPPPPGAAPPPPAPVAPPVHPASDGQPRAVSTWSWWEALLLFLVGNIVIGQFLAAGLVLTVFGLDVATDGGLDLGGIAASIAADLAFVAVVVVYLNVRHRGWPAAIGLSPRGRRIRDATWGALAGLALYPVVSIGVYVIVVTLFRVMFPGEEVSAPDQLAGDLSAVAEGLAVVLAVVLAPVAEELFFRGLLYRSLRDRHGVVLATIVSSVLFGLVHVTFAPWRDVLLLQSVMVFTGIGLAWIYERRGLVASIAAHAVFNIIGVVLIFAAA